MWSSDWKYAGDEIYRAIDSFKDLQREPSYGYDPERQRIQSEFWDRLMSARTTFRERRSEHFEELDARARESAKVKRVICDRAERLTASTDWKQTSERLKRLQKEWKAAGSARGDEEELWSRFSAASDQFFAARSAASAKRAKRCAQLDARLCLAEGTSPKDGETAAREVLDQIGELGPPILPDDFQASERIKQHCHELLDVARHPRRVRQWIALAQLEAYIYEESKRNPTCDTTDVERDARALRMRLESSPRRRP
jgi:hypothetical protein